MKFVYPTSGTTRYRFPTHINDLVIDRAECTSSEVFMVIIEPGKAPPLHKHDDTEQVFFVIEGQGVLHIGADRQPHSVFPGNVVRIPPGILHSIECKSQEPMRYLAVDCFPGGIPREEPTWDAHVQVVCRNQNWDYHSVIGASTEA